MQLKDKSMENITRYPSPDQFVQYLCIKSFNLHLVCRSFLTGHSYRSLLQSCPNHPKTLFYYGNAKYLERIPSGQSIYALP